MAQKARNNGNRTLEGRVLTVIEAQIEDLNDGDLLAAYIGRFRWAIGTRVGVRDKTGQDDYEVINRDDLLVITMGYADTHTQALAAIEEAIGGAVGRVDRLMDATPLGSTPAAPGTC